MTNTPSGSKRPYEGSFEESRKRPRDDTKDWRDVHLNSRRKELSHSRRDSGDYSRGAPQNRSRPSSVVNDYREHHRRSETKSHRSSLTATNGHRRSVAVKEDSEREEGEISPRPSPSVQDHSSHSHDSPNPEPTSQKEPDIELELPASPPLESTLAARRAKRLEILAKYNKESSSNSRISSAVQPAPHLSSISDPLSHIHSSNNGTIMNGVEAENATTISGKRESFSVSPSPGDFALAKEGDEEDAQVKAQAQNQTGEQISAADYDPNQDRREDEGKRGLREVTEEDVEMIEEEEDEDVDDIFAVATTERKKVKKIRKVVKPSAPALITTTLDSAADSEGYYSIILGEQLDGGRYQVFSSLGKGMFSNVVRARVLNGDVGEAGKEVAIKIVRCQDTMYKAGLKEVLMLNKLKQADPDDKKHIVRLERTFEHRGHLFLVFESLSMNLRDVVKRFGKDVGLNIRAVRVYTKQLFLALSLLRKCNVMHADIKPDNILVNEQKTVLKLCDLGSASDASENDITPYLVSRFYRAPEIILGVPYDPSLDIWSLGCTLYELYTGKILFPGRSNNQMLLLMMELKGRFNSKMIKKAKFGDVFFDEMGAFINVDKDRVTGADIVSKVHVTKPSRDLRTRLMPPASAKLQDEELKSITSFVDLLDRCLALDPSRRITPKDALNHPFIRGG